VGALPLVRIGFSVLVLIGLWLTFVGWTATNRPAPVENTNPIRVAFHRWAVVTLMTPKQLAVIERARRTPARIVEIERTRRGTAYRNMMKRYSAEAALEATI
jgi:hypothetical protein